MLDAPHRRRATQRRRGSWFPLAIQRKERPRASAPRARPLNLHGTRSSRPLSGRSRRSARLPHWAKRGSVARHRTPRALDCSVSIRPQSEALPWTPFRGALSAQAPLVIHARLTVFFTSSSASCAPSTVDSNLPLSSPLSSWSRPFRFIFLFPVMARQGPVSRGRRSDRFCAHDGPPVGRMT